MTFHRYDPETCGGHRDRRALTHSILTGFLIGLGMGGVGALFLGSALEPGSGALVRTAAARLESPARDAFGHPVHAAEFVRETPDAR